MNCLTEEDILNDILLTEKNMSNSYSVAINEMSSDKLFKKVMNFFDDTKEMAREIFTFNMAMLFGLVAGTYSSIFISMSVFLGLEKGNIGKPKKKKKIYTDEFEEKKIKGINC